MKKTLSVLAAAAFVLTPHLFADDVVVYADRSNSLGTAQASLATGATLIDTATGGIVIYDESDDVDVIEAPFNVRNGMGATSLTVDLNDVAIQEGDRLVIDFTGVGYGYQNWGLYLTSYDYLWIGIKGFAEWYESNAPLEMAGRFKTSDDGSYIETTAFYIADACDANDEGNPTSKGGLIFFNEDVAPMVRKAEIVPEPATATLSLLALAGLAMRRRRRA